MDFQVLRTDVESGITNPSYILRNTDEKRMSEEMKRLNKISEKDGTMNYYSYRELK